MGYHCDISVFLQLPYSIELEKITTDMTCKKDAAKIIIIFKYYSFSEKNARIVSLKMEFLGIRFDEAF